MVWNNIRTHFLERINGEGWWGVENMIDYYAKHESGSDPFTWIKIYPFMDSEIIKNYIFDHVGEGESSKIVTSLMKRIE